MPKTDKADGEILDAPLERPTTRQDRPGWADRKVLDPEGESWHAEASRRWRAAEDLGAVLGVGPLEMYEPISLPDFGASRSPHVSRDLLGRFLQDRDTNIVHDCYAATEECALDGIRNGTFYHFWSEVLSDPAEDLPCPLCIP